LANLNTSTTYTLGVKAKVDYPNATLRIYYGTQSASHNEVPMTLRVIAL
jgi:hypothetical protein